MPIRHVRSDENEPTESNFPLPKECEHLFQVIDGWEDKNDSDVHVAKLEIIGGEDKGKSILHRLNTNDQLKSFYYTRLFLKSISEPYKGEFDINTDNFIGKQFYATIKINGKYANIDQYNFDKKVDNSGVSRASSQQSSLLDPKDIQWDN